MHSTDSLVSVGLPVRNGAERIERVVESVLAQDHENLELVICDNDSTDGTEDVCRDLAAQDRRIVYHRNPVNVGLLDNFVTALRLATGTFFRWIGDDDWLEPYCVSRGLDVFAADDRLILVTSGMAYTRPYGADLTSAYDGTALGSDDPITRFTEMLRLLDVGYPLVDPLYGMIRREKVLGIGRRNMLHEDEVFAAKLALAGPWGHVPEVLARRNWTSLSPYALARRLDVPVWQVHFATALQCLETMRWLDRCELDDHQRRRARREIGRMYVRHHRIVLTRRVHTLARIAR
ncbi:glycosyltransferase family 2 protein [Rhodococcus aetherivorans]|uniref:glycosyltransferase family 2 protein n=1 Tax=Rhodococcus aetherivorans TaxID=191292 RepID=UPI00045C9F7A|nr:glycosyltransferase family 2 protein [Rhodococcus aetherivorans]KDE15327.1 glycosyltransferase [Rhodococcus aetherivorans]